MKPVLILDLYGTLLSIPKNEHFMSPLVINLLLTTKEPIIAPSIEKSLLGQKSRVYPYEETYKFLEYASKRYHLICMSNLSHHFVKCFYEYKLDKYISETYFSCETGLIKPQPVVYLKVKRKYPDAKLFMIGDSHKNDYLIARKYEIESYWLDREGKKRKIGPDHRITSLMEFHSKIEK